MARSELGRGQVSAAILRELSSGPKTARHLSHAIGQSTGEVSRTMAWMCKQGRALKSLSKSGKLAIYRLPATASET